MSTLSVVIPAHNEVNGIETCLDRLLADAEPGELEVVVICNGCTDDTAERARRRAGVTVVEIDQASKVAALNTGDRVATAFPRLYLDADVALDTESVRHLARAVHGGALAASPRLELDTSGSPWLVRSYLRIWSALPSVRGGLSGRGAFVLSADGRQRFGSFPDVMADDLFVDRLFAPDERAIVGEVASVVSAPRTVSDLVARKTRVFTGNLQLGAGAATYSEPAPNGRPGSATRADAAPTSDRTAWLRVVRRTPARLADVPAYLYVTLLAKRRARQRVARQDFTWDRDASTRLQGP